MSFRFSKAERLTARSKFAELALKGSSHREGDIRLRTLLYPEQEEASQVAFTVPKRNVKKAVDRNRIKRQMRESFRLLKPDLYKCINDVSIKASFLFVYQGKEPIPTETMRYTMQRLIERWIKEHASANK